MLNTTPGTGCFVQVPDESSQRILQSAVVQDYKEKTYTAELREDAAMLESGQDIFVYYEFKNEFMRQPARIDVIADTPSGCTFSFQFTGDAVSAERRKCYRVSTVMAAITATFGDEENCAVLDVSATGLAVLGANQRKIGHVVETIVSCGDENFSGQGRIESIRESNCGRFRYGLHCVDARPGREALRIGLQKISAVVQREHLRRLSRAG